MAATLVGCRSGYQIDETRTSIPLGEGSVDVVVYEAEAPGMTFITLHDNEDTSVEAALAVLGKRGGRLIELQHSGERNIEFQMGDSLYTIDPNRIFTDAGAAATLDTLGAYSDSAHAAVRAFAKQLVDIYDLRSQDVVITLHNNTADEYSALSYTEGRDYEEDARFVYIAPDEDPDDFFFITDYALYNPMRDAGFNVVLQDNANVTDDGSLSVYCGTLGLPYINVEAEHGHTAEQVRMIEYLLDLLKAESPAGQAT